VLKLETPFRQFLRTETNATVAFPIRRLMTLKTLLASLVKTLPETYADYRDLQEASKQLERILQELDGSKRALNVAHRISELRKVLPKGLPLSEESYVGEVDSQYPLQIVVSQSALIILKHRMFKWRFVEYAPLAPRSALKETVRSKIDWTDRTLAQLLESVADEREAEKQEKKKKKEKEKKKVEETRGEKADLQEDLDHLGVLMRVNGFRTRSRASSSVSEEPSYLWASTTDGSLVDTDSEQEREELSWSGGDLDSDSWGDLRRDNEVFAQHNLKQEIRYRSLVELEQTSSQMRDVLEEYSERLSAVNI
jgi:hypothetical protein